MANAGCRPLAQLPRNPETGQVQKSLNTDFIFLHDIVTTVFKPQGSPFISSLSNMYVWFALSSHCHLVITKKIFKYTIDDFLQSFFPDYIYFSIHLQFFSNIKSCNIFVNASVMQLKIVLACEPVDNVWSSLDADGAMILVILEEGTALKGLHGDQWSILECTITRWSSTPVSVLKKSIMSGLLSSVQVIKYDENNFSFSHSSVFQSNCFWNNFKTRNDLSFLEIKI